ncbi:UPF0158 family protein [Actinophytocola sp. NPDC049390]|uniref:UPF0158 family protein n=1 Tax=Actinophytocola sp. NPDC049390 TaxID=3363894 RepID=UPI0037B72F49
MSTGDMLGESQHNMMGRREDAFKLLVTAVELLQRASRERPPTASQVRIQLRELTYGGFRLADLGYSRFREFLADAEKRDFVKLDSGREGDLGVALPDVIGNRISVRPAVVRRDVWKAFVNWNQSLARWYDVEHDRAIVLPRQPAILEPQEFQESRKRIEEHPENFVPIEPISVGMQLGWMRKFTSTIADPELRKLLEAALDGAQPAKTFVAILKKFPAQLDHWHIALTNEVRAVIGDWKAANPRLQSLVIDRIDSEGKEESIPGPVVERPDHSFASRISLESLLRLAAGSKLWHFSNTEADARGHHKREGEDRVRSTESEMRESLHAAIDRMPIDELRRIRLPIGYLYSE